MIRKDGWLAVRAKQRMYPSGPASIFYPEGMGVETTTIATQRVHGWDVYLGKSWYTVQHIAGDLNYWADALSGWESESLWESKRPHTLSTVAEVFSDDTSHLWKRDSIQEGQLKAICVLSSPTIPERHLSWGEMDY